MKLWNADKNTEILTLKEESLPYCVAFSPDSKRILSGNLDKTLRVWDIDKAKNNR